MFHHLKSAWRKRDYLKEHLMGILYNEASIVRPVKNKNASIYTPFTQGLTARLFLEISWKKGGGIFLS